MKSNHAHAPWRKVVLIPFWTIQLLIGFLDLALLGLAIGVIVQWEHNQESDSCVGLDCNEDLDVSTEAKIIVPIWMAGLLVCLILTISEIIFLAKHKLKPKTFVIFNTVKSLIWTIFFVLDIVSFVDSNSRTTTFFGLILEAVLWLCFIIPLIYGSVLYHRERKGRLYNPVSDPLAPVNAHDDWSVPDVYTGYNTKPSYNNNIESQPQRQSNGERHASYDHQRDTRFEAFRRTSLGQNNSYRAYGQQSPEAPWSVGYRGQESTGGVVGSPEIPQVFVQHHDGETFEMESGSRAGMR